MNGVLLDPRIVKSVAEDFPHIYVTRLHCKKTCTTQPDVGVSRNDAERLSLSIVRKVSRPVET